MFLAPLHLTVEDFCPLGGCVFLEHHVTRCFVTAYFSGLSVDDTVKFFGDKEVVTINDYRGIFIVEYFSP